MCGRGTRAFEARVEGGATTLVVKDCWLEDRQDRALEHDTVERVRGAVGQAEFRRRFIGHLRLSHYSECCFRQGL